MKPSHTDDELAAEDAAAIDDALLRVMELCRLALSLGDLDLGNLLEASEGRSVRMPGSY